MPAYPCPGGGSLPSHLGSLQTFLIVVFSGLSLLLDWSFLSGAGLCLFMNHPSAPVCSGHTQMDTMLSPGESQKIANLSLLGNNS